MTTPYGGSNNPGPDNSGNSDGNQDWPRYESTNHPEDQSGYGYENYGSQNQGTPANDPYGQYNAGGGLPSYNTSAGYDSQYSDYNNGDATQPVANPDIFHAIRWGFAATFRNWSLWILGGIAFFIVAVVAGGGLGLAMGSMGVQSTYSEIISSLLILLVMPIVYALILHQIDHQNTGWGHIGSNMNYGPTVGISLIVQVATWLLMGAPLYLMGMNDQDLFAQEVVSSQDMNEFLIKFGGTMLVIFVLAIAISPFVFSLVWLVADRRASIGSSFGQSIAIGKAYYLKILGYSVIAGLMTVVLLIFTLGLAGIIVIPAVQLASGHFYRQISGGAVPAESRSY